MPSFCADHKFCCDAIEFYRFDNRHLRWHDGGMLRRVHVTDLRVGSIALAPAEAHHVRDVLRMDAGSALELFNDAGQTAGGVIKHLNSANVVVEVQSVIAASARGAIELTIASAIPKGDRADWMIEKLSELGVARFIPLATERSIVLPAGRNKIERWERTALESAKQCRRTGVMTIAALTPIDEAIRSTGAGWYLSTELGAIPANAAVKRQVPDALTVFVGAEGGWSEGEISRMDAAGLVGVSLTATVLRVETAAVTAAGLLLSLTETRSPPNIGLVPPLSP